MGKLVRVAPEHLRPFSESEDRHMTLQSKQPITTELFAEVVESTDFQKGTFLDLRQQPGPPDEHVPPLHKQVFEPHSCRTIVSWTRTEATGEKRRHCWSVTEIVKTFRIG